MKTIHHFEDDFLLLLLLVFQNCGEATSLVFRFRFGATAPSEGSQISQFLSNDPLPKLLWLNDVPLV